MRRILGVVVIGVGVLFLAPLPVVAIVYVLVGGGLPLPVAPLMATTTIGIVALAAGSSLFDADRADTTRSWLARNRLRLGLGVVATCAASGLLVAWSLRVDWGTPTQRVLSPTGEFEVVQYEWTAVIDPAWNLAIERVDGDGREWFWRSVEGPGPATITFVAPTTVEVVDELGGRYLIEFDPDSLEPSDRFCLRPEYCYSRPWDGYTRESP